MIDILYIVGFGRSGSTILGNVLNEHPDMFHTGEIQYIWEHGFLQNRLCGCGLKFQSCPIWSQVREKITNYKNIKPINAINARDDLPRNKGLIARNLVGQLITRHEYYKILYSLYFYISHFSGHNVIVDSSKTPHYLYYLLHTDGLNVKALHLVRDPRGTAYSWSKHKNRDDIIDGDTSYMSRLGLINHSRRWLSCNITTEFILSQYDVPSMRLKYEQFARHPRDSVSKILTWLDLNKNIQFADSNSIFLGENHTVWGNPDRSQTGATHIKIDSEWLSNISISNHVFTSLICFPFIRLYGYM